MIRVMSNLQKISIVGLSVIIIVIGIKLIGVLFNWADNLKHRRVMMYGVFIVVILVSYLIKKHSIFEYILNF